MKPLHPSCLVIAILLLACGHNKTEEKPLTAFHPARQQQTLTDTTGYSTEGLLKEESLGGFKTGMPFRGILKGWSAAPKVLWEGDGLVHQSFMNSATTNEVNLCSNDSAMANAVVSSVTAGPRSAYKTARNIGIGSSYEEVFKAYKSYINSGETNDTLIVAGSVYGGLIFNFEKGKVARIFMGAAAE